MSVLQQLKQLVYKDLDPTKYDQLLTKIGDRLTDIKLVKTMSLSRFLNQGSMKNAFSRMISHITVGQIETDRLNRYKTFEQIYQLIPEANQALNIYSDNILSPDVVTKETLYVQSKESIPASEDLTTKIQSLFYNIIDFIKLRQKLEKIVKDFLLYGESFIEIIDANTINTKKWTFLQEKQQNLQDVIAFIVDVSNASISECVIKESNDDHSLAKVSIKVHSPKHVVAFYLGDEPFGFLVIKPYGANKTNVNIKRKLADELLNLLMNNQKQLKQLLSDYPGFKYEIARVIQNIESDKAYIKFVPADNMVHIKIPSSIFEPYGESILTPIIDIAKYIIAAERAALIYRLTRAPEKRVFKINVFRDKLEAPEALQEVINETKQKEIAVSNAGDIDALMTEITMFDDIYIPVYDGTPAFDVEVLPGGDLTAKIEDLNYFKDKLIAGLGIPPVYLKPQDQQADNKSTLAQENARFARTIIRLQSQISAGLTELVYKIISIVEPDKLMFAQNFIVTLLPPTALMAEREQEVVNAVSNLIEALSKHGVPAEVILKKYLPQFNWDEIKTDASVTTKIDKMIGSNTEQEE